MPPSLLPCLGLSTDRASPVHHPLNLNLRTPPRLRRRPLPPSPSPVPSPNSTAMMSRHATGKEPICPSRPLYAMLSTALESKTFTDSYTLWTLAAVPVLRLVAVTPGRNGPAAMWKAPARPPARRRAGLGGVFGDDDEDDAGGGAGARRGPPEALWAPGDAAPPPGAPGGGPEGDRPPGGGAEPSAKAEAEAEEEVRGVVFSRRGVPCCGTARGRPSSSRRGRAAVLRGPRILGALAASLG